MYKLPHYLILGILSLLFFVPGIANLPVIDRDEAHFAQATRQMLQTGEYFQIRFQDKTRFQKPPGINWLQAASVGLLSNPDANNIWPYRIPSVLGALFSVLLLYFFSRCFITQRSALLASGLFATALLLLVEAHMAVIDASLLSSVLLMQGALWFCYKKGINNEPVHWGWAVCFWLAMAYGMVLKGVTPLVGVLTVVSLCCIEKQVKWLRGLRIYQGLLFFIVITLGWLFMVNAAENSNYLMQMLHKDLLPKLQGGHESHGKPPFFHLAILPLTFWPASLFLWQGGVYAFYNRHTQSVKFLLAWLLPTWFFFEIMPTKLPQYVLPVFPAIALLCALAIEKADKAVLPGKWLRFLQLMWGVLSIGLAISLVVIPYLVTQETPLVSLVLLVSLTVMTVVSVYFSWHANYYRASIAVIMTALVAYPLIFAVLLPGIKPIWLSDTIARLIDQHQISEDKPLMAVGFSEPSLVFNLNTRIVEFSDSSTAEQTIKTDATRLALIESSIINEWARDGLDFSVKARAKGYNYTKGRWVELFLVEQNRRL
ncbi:MULTISPECIES: glycosyltransferase family 39 protein [unclassified Legionella]|uniref:ArnT family glycosyltransferase n=1 Tax=unclassified Legionella TaxID=2622702 RepID=UPI0010545254|nr:MULTISPECIES: glycosyltransferase family 39 protein [unclassified Legionella]MDI9817693.1 glycosyltransferase family 39 protein [Legionella sp. PL877]